MFKKYQKGKHVYSTFDGKSERVTVISRKKEKDETPPLEIEISPSEIDGKISNLYMVYHSPEEFMIDFCLVLPGQNKAKVLNRVIMSPRHAKRFMKVLESALSNLKHE
ncbi:MAG: DUF3467 domain-containing protein [Elusimicrobiota bacterium]